MGTASERREKYQPMLKGTSKLDILTLRWPRFFFYLIKLVVLVTTYTVIGEVDTVSIYLQLLYVSKEMETTSLFVCLFIDYTEKCNKESKIM